MMFEGDWGCCPNKRMSKSSKQGPVYTACQFVKGQNIILRYFYFRKITLSNLWPICPQAEIFFLLFWTCAQLGQKWYVEIQIGKQWKVVPLPDFWKSSSGAFHKNACKGSIPGTLWTVSLILAAYRTFEIRIGRISLVLIMSLPNSDHCQNKVWDLGKQLNIQQRPSALWPMGAVYIN